MLTINPKEIQPTKLHAYLLGAVTPRPIAFASTIDQQGNVNLSPFSFFNCFGYNPPILIFSPARRGRDNTTKHTYENVLEVPEVVVNMVNFDMVQQVSLASADFPKGIDEFVKAGFTAAKSTMVRPPRVEESPISMECKVQQIISTGSEGGAGILVVCEILLMHIKETVLDVDGKIDPTKLDAIARLGADYYARINEQSIFRVPRPAEKPPVGVDNIPSSIRLSKVLSGNDLGLLGNVLALPSDDEIITFGESNQVGPMSEEQRHRFAKRLIAERRVADAWKVLLLKK